MYNTQTRVFLFWVHAKPSYAKSGCVNGVCHESSNQNAASKEGTPAWSSWMCRGAFKARVQSKISGFNVYAFPHKCYLYTLFTIYLKSPMGPTNLNSINEPPAHDSACAQQPWLFSYNKMTLYLTRSCTRWPALGKFLAHDGLFIYFSQVPHAHIFSSNVT